jgi:hypothetical protein
MKMTGIGTTILLIGLGLMMLYFCLMSDTIFYQLEHPGPTPSHGVKTGTGLDRVYLAGDGDEGTTLTGFFTLMLAGAFFGAVGLMVAKNFGGGCALLMVLLLFFVVIGMVYMATTVQ